MPRSFTFATIAEYQAAKGNSGAIYAELVSSGIKSGSCVSKITATGDVFIDSINPFVTPELGQEGDTLYYSSSEGYRFLRSGNTTWDADSYGQVYIDLAKIPSGFSVVAPYTDIFNYKQTDENIGSGKASMTKILGNTVAWNQIIVDPSISDTANWGTNPGYTVTTSGNVKTFSVSNGYYKNAIRQVGSIVSGHKYYCSARCRIASGTGQIKILGQNKQSSATDTLKDFNLIMTATTTSDTHELFAAFGTQQDKAFSFEIDTKRGVNIHDLTLLYGSAIDGLTDAQILAKFESEFPGYHSYNAGTLLSNKAKAIEFVGFNKWDEEWEGGDIAFATGKNANGAAWMRCKNYISVFPSTSYYFKYKDVETNAYFYDINKKYLGRYTGGLQTNVQNASFTTPAGCAYMRFATKATSYDHDICINLSGNRNGQYEPYKKVVLPLPNLDQIKVYSHNLYDPATGKAKVEGGKQYYIGGTYTSISQNGIAITVSSHLFTPSASGDVDVVGGNSTDTIINLSSSFNGQYEPHGILTINGVKSAGSVYDEIVGNKYVKRIGRVDLGTLEWDKTSGDYWRFEAVISDIKKPSSDAVKANILCGKYVVVTLATVYNHSSDKSIGIHPLSGAAWIYDTAYTSLTNAQFKVEMSGVMLNYELATPIEYEIYSPTKMPFNWKYRVSEYHTKKMLPENVENPTSAPFACEIKQI